MPPKNPPSVPHQGTEYFIVACPWCGSPSPVYQDRKGHPWARCSFCLARLFGSPAALQLAQNAGRVVTAVWPPAEFDPGEVRCG